METIRFWCRAARVWAFPATLVPVLVGSLAAVEQGAPFRPGLFIMTLAGTLALHAAANMHNDVDDHAARVDRRGTYGSSGLLVEGALAPARLRRAAVIAAAAGSALGLAIAALTGWGVIWLGVFGVASVLLYTTLGRLKYRGLGDLQIFLTFGPAVTLGAYYVQAGRFGWLPLALSLPVGMLTDAILHSNNLRDLEADRQAGIRTLAMSLGRAGSRSFYAWLVNGAYAVVFALVILGRLTPWALAVLATRPLARRALDLVALEGQTARADFAAVDVRTAQLQLAFGLTLSAALLLGAWL